MGGGEGEETEWGEAEKGIKRGAERGVEGKGVGQRGRESERQRRGEKDRGRQFLISKSS